MNSGTNYSLLNHAIILINMNSIAENRLKMFVSNMRNVFLYKKETVSFSYDPLLSLLLPVRNKKKR